MKHSSALNAAAESTALAAIGVQSPPAHRCASASRHRAQSSPARAAHSSSPSRQSPGEGDELLGLSATVGDRLCERSQTLCEGKGIALVHSVKLTAGRRQHGTAKRGYAQQRLAAAVRRGYSIGALWVLYGCSMGTIWVLYGTGQAEYCDTSSLTCSSLSVDTP